ncbi:hypothetical protein KSB_52740 [Ktedonobacter robiniae]|uniref:Uncharacterized protein n=1 Tax=Ktedonobacter robiniae TaxID=2778365 RepID=A0ABQ3UVU5_9CHLR|nr:hypothetical protein KSB_52740 [Ktedonobacter robiniae]
MNIPPCLKGQLFPCPLERYAVAEPMPLKMLPTWPMKYVTIWSPSMAMPGLKNWQSVWN